MMHRRFRIAHGMRFACVLSLLCASTLACAQTQVIETTYATSTSEKKIGAQYRADVDAARKAAMEQRSIPRALELLQPALEFCQALPRPNLHLVSVATTQEYETYLAENASGQPTEWVDMACPDAYKLMGYIHAGAKQTDEALEWLDRAIELAPFFADAYIERGFALGQSGKLDEALKAYRFALTLAETKPSAAHAKPLALRGQGWVLVEMGDLDSAQRAYEASLEAEPDNRLAKSELDYISKLRASHR